MEQQIRKYLSNPQGHPRPSGDQQPHFAYLITYLGQLFTQGNRIIQQYPQFLLLSCMQFQMPQPSTKDSLKSNQKQKRSPPQARFKIFMWQMASKPINENGKARRQIYSQLQTLGRLLQDPQYHIVYLRDRSYSVLRQSDLDMPNRPPDCFSYFSKIKWIEEKNGAKPIYEKEEGIQMHKLVETFIKGAGEGRSRHTIRNIQGHHKFTYDLFKVINSVCYILGKEVLQNDYQTMSVEKWMRKTTAKKFKRYDLLMRNQHKISILDWKFTRLDAQEKIRGASTQKKNQQYVELARKDFKTSDIQLKFYCLHERKINSWFHMFTCAKFKNQISTVELDSPQKNNQREGNAKVEKPKRAKKKQKNEFDFSYGEIIIYDSDVELLESAEGKQMSERIQNEKGSKQIVQARVLAVTQNKIENKSMKEEIKEVQKKREKEDMKKTKQARQERIVQERKESLEQIIPLKAEVIKIQNIICLDSEDEVQIFSPKRSNPVNQLLARKSALQSQRKQPSSPTISELQRLLTTKKKVIKQQKFLQKFVPHNIYQIQSD